MANCAEYLPIWLGLTRIGVVVALVNSQLSGNVLAHSINIVDPRYLIVGADLAPRIAAIRPHLPASLACRVLGSSTVDLKPMEPELAAVAGEPLLLSECASAFNRRDCLVYLYLRYDRLAEGGEGQPLPSHASGAIGSPA